VTITGTHFFGVTHVGFDGSFATSFTVNSFTSITAVSPAHSAGVVDVIVTTYGGSSPTGVPDNFTYTSGGAPAPRSSTRASNGSAPERDPVGTLSGSALSALLDDMALESSDSRARPLVDGDDLAALGSLASLLPSLLAGIKSQVLAQNSMPLSEHTAQGLARAQVLSLFADSLEQPMGWAEMGPA
jgi:hypothetical protein